MRLSLRPADARTQRDGSRDASRRAARAWRVATLAALAASLVACEGPVGPPGPPGSPVDGGLTDAGGTAADAESPRDDAGAALTGSVRDPSESYVGGGRVVLLRAERVASLAATPINLALAGAVAAQVDNDEPIEDAIARDPDPLFATVDERGHFRLESVPEGSFFVVYLPAADDETHLPGGQLSRAPLSAGSLRGATLDLRVSSAPSARARYVGSSWCVSCHARHPTFASAHALTLRVPGLSGPHQDISAAPRIDEALTAFAAGTRLYFYDCDPARTERPSCRVGTAAPSDLGSVRLRATLGVDASLAEDATGRYFVELERGSARVRYPVALTLGGARTAQQYVTRIPRGTTGFTHLVLPFTYQLAGKDDRPDYRDHRWVSFRVEDWLGDTADALRTPPEAQTFERQCAGCHMTGFRGGAQGGGSAAVDPDGIYDLDGDGRKEALAVGCEACHGPGSEHLEVAPRGQRIVSPRLITPERQTLICGQCHARHRGQRDEAAPLDTELRMPRPGMARSAFLARHVSRIDVSPTLRFGSGDPRLGFEQYGDFLRSRKYRNATLLVSCTDCHDPHRSAGFPFDLRDASGDGSCAACHALAGGVTTHAKAEVGFEHDRGVAPETLACTACHMVRTGTSGARTEALIDRSNPNATATYFHGDRASHRFVFEGRAHVDEQPVAATAACAGCHGALFITP